MIKEVEDLRFMRREKDFYQNHAKESECLQEKPSTVHNVDTHLIHEKLSAIGIMCFAFRRLPLKYSK